MCRDEFFDKSCTSVYENTCLAYTMRECDSILIYSNTVLIANCVVKCSSLIFVPASQLSPLMKIKSNLSYMLNI